MTTKTNTGSSRAGLGFTGALTIAFVVLKLCGVITWSWLWVLSPLWIGVAVGLVIAAVAVLIAVVTR